MRSHIQKLQILFPSLCEPDAEPWSEGLFELLSKPAKMIMGTGDGNLRVPTLVLQADKLGLTKATEVISVGSDDDDDKLAEKTTTKKPTAKQPEDKKQRAKKPASDTAEKRVERDDNDGTSQ